MSHGLTCRKDPFGHDVSVPTEVGPLYDLLTKIVAFKKRMDGVSGQRTGDELAYYLDASFMVCSKAWVVSDPVGCKDHGPCMCPHDSANHSEHAKLYFKEARSQLWAEFYQLTQEKLKPFKGEDWDGVINWEEVPALLGDSYKLYTYISKIFETVGRGAAIAPNDPNDRSELANYDLYPEDPVRSMKECLRRMVEPLTRVYAAKREAAQLREEARALDDSAMPVLPGEPRLETIAWLRGRLLNMARLSNACPMVEQTGESLTLIKCYLVGSIRRHEPEWNPLLDEDIAPAMKFGPWSGDEI